MDKKFSFEECLTLFASPHADDLVLAATSLVTLSAEDHPGLERIYELLLGADKKCPGVADTYWLAFYDSTVTGDPLTIDWMFNVLEQREREKPLAVLLDGNNLEFHLHEAIDYRADDLIRAIESGLTHVVNMALEHWSNTAFSPKDFPWDRHADIAKALRKSPDFKMRSLLADFSKSLARNVD